MEKFQPTGQLLHDGSVTSQMMTYLAHCCHHVFSKQAQEENSPASILIFRLFLSLFKMKKTLNMKRNLFKSYKKVRLWLRRYSGLPVDCRVGGSNPALTLFVMSLSRTVDLELSPMGLQHFKWQQPLDQWLLWDAGKVPCKCIRLPQYCIGFQVLAEIKGFF